MAKFPIYNAMRPEARRAYEVALDTFNRTVAAAGMVRGDAIALADHEHEAAIKAADDAHTAACDAADVAFTAELEAL